MIYIASRQGLAETPSMPPGYLSYATFSDNIIRIGKCDLGHGVFANKHINEGEKILTFKGDRIDFLQTKTKGSWECMPLQIDDDLYIDTEPIGVFVNHSCNPNSGIRGDECLIALRSIAKGEEIRFDYSTTMQEQSFTMECRCGAHNCRSIVDDFQTLPDAQRKVYLRAGIVMRFIAKKYECF